MTKLEEEKISTKINRNKYERVHQWLKYHYGKAIKCENLTCKYLKPKRFEWANISGEYKKDRTNWIQLCPSCHRKMDYTEKQREKFRKRMIGTSYASKGEIKQFDLSMNLIKTWENIRKASIGLEICHSSIHNVLARRAKTAGGYIWKKV